jgi:Zn ribbon nucleic-acid-binding protein
MMCPKCKGKTKVTRTFDSVRQRVCLGCGFKFVTEEVVKPDGKVPFK